MAFVDEIAGALEELEEDLSFAGETQKLILPSDAEIPCVPSTEDVGTSIQVGPRVEEITASVIVRRSHFITADSSLITADSDVILADNSTAKPKSGNKPTFRGRTYRVLSVKEDASRAYFKVLMGSAK